jgi:predicted small lipoprotein YifL
MPLARTMIAAALLSLAGCGFSTGPDAHGPAWIERPTDTLVEKMGKPDRLVRLPPPSLVTVYLYTGGAEPGFAVCQRDYFIRGQTVIGYSEHGTAPNCNRSAGRTE